jgi:hypothetical protein
MPWVAAAIEEKGSSRLPVDQDIMLASGCANTKICQLISSNKRSTTIPRSGTFHRSGNKN